MKGDMAWGWIKSQIAKNVMDKSWTPAANLSRIADIFAGAMVLMGKCRLPFYISKSTAEDRFLIRRLVGEQRMERQGWTFMGNKEERTSLRLPLALFRRIAERNRVKARIRYLRARHMDS